MLRLIVYRYSIEYPYTEWKRLKKRLCITLCWIPLRMTGHLQKTDGYKNSFSTLLCHLLAHRRNWTVSSLRAWSQVGLVGNWVWGAHVGEQPLGDQSSHGHWLAALAAGEAVARGLTGPLNSIKLYERKAHTAKGETARQRNRTSVRETEKNI